MEKQQVYVWGFDAEAMAGPLWPQDLEPVPVTTWPHDAPVVVHAQAAAAFQAAALQHPWPDGRLPEAILYLPRGEGIPATAWGFFDTTVQAGDWPTLRRLLEDPQQFRMAEMADELPAAFLEGLEGPVDELPADAFPLPAAVRQHLAQHRLARAAFNRALADRLRLRRQLEGLIRTPHPAAMPGPIAAREPAPVWLAVPLRSMWAVATGLTRTMDTMWQVLTPVLVGCLQQNLHPVGAEATRSGGRARARSTLDVRALLERLQQGQEVQLLRPHRELTIAPDRTGQAVLIRELYGTGEVGIEAFQVQIRQETRVLWEAHSAQGTVRIPLAVLEQALQNGADEFVILAWEG
jgi:hypothetical protein